MDTYYTLYSTYNLLRILRNNERLNNFLTENAKLINNLGKDVMKQKIIITKGINTCWLRVA